MSFAATDLLSFGSPVPVYGPAITTLFVEQRARPDGLARPGLIPSALFVHTAKSLYFLYGNEALFSRTTAECSTNSTLAGLPRMVVSVPMAEILVDGINSICGVGPPEKIIKHIMILCVLSEQLASRQLARISANAMKTLIFINKGILEVGNLFHRQFFLGVRWDLAVIWKCPLLFKSVDAYLTANITSK